MKKASSKAGSLGAHDKELTMQDDYKQECKYSQQIRIMTGRNQQLEVSTVGERLEKAKFLSDLVVRSKRITHGSNRSNRRRNKTSKNSSNAIKPMSPEVESNLIEILQSGEFKTYEEVAKKVGTSRFTVSAYAKLLNCRTELSKMQTGDL